MLSRLRGPDLLALGLLLVAACSNTGSQGGSGGTSGSGTSSADVSWLSA
jgi:hypothetical protein